MGLGFSKRTELYKCKLCGEQFSSGSTTTYEGHMNIVFTVKFIEYGIGLTMHQEGYLVFANEQSAIDYIEREGNGRVSLSYVEYEIIGEKPCSFDFFLGIISSPDRHLYAAELVEMYWSKEHRREKYAH